MDDGERPIENERERRQLRAQARVVYRRAAQAALLLTLLSLAPP